MKSLNFDVIVNRVTEFLFAQKLKREGKQFHVTVRDCDQSERTLSSDSFTIRRSSIEGGKI